MRYTITPMRRALPYVALLAFSLTLIQPLVSSNQICVDDLQFHVHKAYELENLIRSGNFFPRWSPDMGRGYGYPLFNFYAPLSSYPLVALHLTTGTPYPFAIHLTLLFYLYLAGLGMFLFARDLFSDCAAFVSAIAYMSAPYLAYNVMFRGALAEVSGWMWIPLALWAIRRAMLRSSWRWAIIGAICYAALIQSHNLLALLSTPMIVGWAIVIALDLEGFAHSASLRGASHNLQNLFRRSSFGIVAITLGLSLAAYFWLPVLVERAYVRTDRLLDSPVLQYFNNFIAPSELYSQWASDPLLFNPAPSRGLGLITAILASLGAITFIITTIRSQRQTLSPLSFLSPISPFSPLSFISPISPFSFISPISFLIFTTLLYCFLTLQISQPIWDVTPLMPFFQFPWRMLTPAALGAAVLAGVFVNLQITKMPRAQSSQDDSKQLRDLSALRVFVINQDNISTFIACAALIFFNLPWWSPTYCGVTPPTTPETIRQFRAETLMEGAHSYSEYLPRWVKNFPQDDELFNALIEGKSPERLVITDAKTETHSTNPLYANYAVTVSQNTEAIYKQFYYPGWSVEVDGKQIEIQPDPESGVIRFNVPAGVHTLRVRFGETPLRLLADVISVLAVIVCLVAATPDRSIYIGTLHRNVSTRGWAALIVLGLGLFALKVLVLDRVRASSFDGEKVANTKPLRASFAGGVELYGYDLNSTAASGDWFDVTLYAGVKEKVGGAYVPTISVEDERGLLVSEADVTFPRWLRPPFSANQWSPNYYALWARRVATLPATPPGTYRVWGKVFDADDPSRAPDSVIDSQGNALAPRFDLGTITVTRPSKAASIESLKMQNVSNTKLNESLTLLGWNVDRAEAKAGDTMLITLFWKLEKEMIKDQRLEIGLSDASGKNVFAKEIDPVSENFPTSQWKVGDVWRGQSMIRLPAALSDGGYRWGIRLKGETAAAALGAIRVAAPQRSFIALSVDQKAGARFDSFAELVGYSIREQKIILVWRALKTPEKSYSVFVHVGDANRIWAQSDGEPQNWTRPTTGWVEGEYVVDERVIALPPDAPRGEYAIYVGMADVVTGERVKINEREERIRIGVIQK